MLLNEELTRRTLVHAATLEWMPSPAKGVDRRMLFRIGDERARATSVVRYAPESSFLHHQHPGGEEFLVLDGVFQDESGNFPAGTYVRNPPGTGHAPRSDGGCTILVKLWQFRAADRERIVRLPGEGQIATLRPGVMSAIVLFEGSHERVVMEEWQAGADVEVANPEGLELFVIDGDFTESGDTLDPWSWLRLPAGLEFHAKAGPLGTRVWYKSAPLLHEDVQAFDAPLPEGPNR
ncbi:cupin domain-containing protein [Rhizobium multihospitium]|uniref:ChrR Cupin-like domain-containing protein n=1 Tax=Rhizobium multihospitium TaxID=410764 RepID=A0A1C3W2C4_9HYPH|nr:cupin domain-containing protein [Rhizobium multihospitium]SCB34173.1 ChrR Cupin-like domain-containing protein [Rhizobium multihospitium]